MFKKRGFALLLLTFLAVHLFAREVEILVEDADTGLPVEGALIHVGRSGEQAAADYDSDAGGRALVVLAGGTEAVIRVSCPGYETRRLVIGAETVADTAPFRVELRLGGVLESRELVLEEARPEAAGGQSGRSVAISGPELRRTAEIGIVEDVMTSIKLLPGVGYAGMFNAMPSIRGGDPGDLMAALDGFYLSQPYHWGGGISIFDPRMVSSAKLSHGVFSARYGHTISGLLEITSRKPSAEAMELESGLSTSAASLNLSYPLPGRGGIMFMGKVTYWDTFVWALKGLSRLVENETLSMVNSVSTPPYIRSAALAVNYRFTGDLELGLNGFFGSDGVGAAYRNAYDDSDVRGNVDMDFVYNNYQGFIVSALSFSPSPRAVLKFTAGAGFTQMEAGGFISNDVEVRYSQAFLDAYRQGGFLAGITTQDSYHAPGASGDLDSRSGIAHVQGRLDFDLELGRGFMFAAGAQELYNRWQQEDRANVFFEQRLDPSLAWMLPGLAAIPNAAVIRPLDYSLNVLNQGFSSTAYALVEYTGPRGIFGGELGLRADHLYFIGRDFSVQTVPALNPRLNVDFTLLRDAGIIESLSITAGTGLFSSINENISFMDGRSGIGDFDIKPNRSFTTVIGTKIDFTEGISFNLEAYFKYVFDRAYLSAGMETQNPEARFSFDAEGRIWGFDFQLQKFTSRYWDGWISYSFNHARYREPSQGQVNAGGSNTVLPGQWYYPSFHRFHNFNLVLNIKPSRRFAIAARFGFASGRPKSRAGEIYPYPVALLRWDETTNRYVEQRWDENAGAWVDAPSGGGTIIQKFRRDSAYHDDERTTWSLPLDLKFSFFILNRKGRVTTEVYLGAENLLSLIYRAEANTRFNEYTGRIDTGGNSASYELPVPMVSFGFTWSY
ncbi:MAG: hypothetical protein LBQ35_00820 [Spirochaetaceae bacterium]|jgi:hypothetical protein|nr:hypothetical protein [Spirochaetaceae bacterium]